LSIRAEIISIGDELTSGQRLDTNSQWLSIQLADLGVSTAFHTTVGDTLVDNIDAFRTASRRAQIVISTGGLGPTADDLTREALAEAFDCPLEFRQAAMDHIESLFAKRKRPMPDRNRVQAMFPRSSLDIPNPHGTAPGIDLTVKNDCRIFALPGVPAEMMQMWEQTVLKRLINEMNVGAERWFYRTLKVFGIGESDVEVKLPDLIHRDRIPRVGITVSKATISLRIACLAKNEQEAIEASRPTEKIIHDTLGELVFGQADDELDDVVHRWLVEHQQTLSLIEIGGDTLMASWLAKHTQATQTIPTSAPNSGEACDQDGTVPVGLVASRWYPNMPKGDDDLKTMQRLVEDFRKETDTDWSLVIGPYPQHTVVETMKSMPTSQFVIGLASKYGVTRSERFELGGHPELIFHRIAKAGLDYFRRHATIHHS
jgi:nicotinamide-nucleotide amidase